MKNNTNSNTNAINLAAVLAAGAAALAKNPADKPQPLPWHMAESGMPEIYDAAGELVTAFGNDSNGLAQDFANARFVVETVNAIWRACAANA